jgi:hypothetical protein
MYACMSACLSVYACLLLRLFARNGPSATTCPSFGCVRSGPHVLLLLALTASQDSVVASADLAGQIIGHNVTSGAKQWHLSAKTKARRSTTM